jgi:hypothetical protein
MKLSKNAVFAFLNTSLLTNITSDTLRIFQKNVKLFLI